MKYFWFFGFFILSNCIQQHTYNDSNVEIFLPGAIGFANGFAVPNAPDPDENSTNPDPDNSLSPEDELYYLKTIAGNITGGAVDGIGTEAKFNNPQGFTIDNGALYIADYLNHAIRRIDLDNYSVTTIAGKLGEPGSTIGDYGINRLNKPMGITASNEYFYVTDGNYSIKRISKSTFKMDVLIGLTGISGITDDPPRFAYPASIIYNNNSLFLADICAIRKINLNNNTLTTIVGSMEGNNCDVIDGTGVNAKTQGPGQLFIKNGYIYFVSPLGYAVRRVSIDTLVVETISGQGNTVGTVDGTATVTRYRRPNGIAVAENNIYVADSGNATIRKIQMPDYVSSTLSGIPLDYGTIDGKPNVAKYKWPGQIIPYGKYLFISDHVNHTVRRLRYK